MRVWLNGNDLARKLMGELREALVKDSQRWGCSPQLHIVNVGFNDASLSYIKKKMDLAAQVGIKFQLHQFVDHPQHSHLKAFKKMTERVEEGEVKMYEYEGDQAKQSATSIVSLIRELNQKKEVSGILMQLPLQPQLLPFTGEIIETIAPGKDVDCLTLTNRAKMLEHGENELLPCTPQGVLRILDEHKVDVQGKKVVIAGRSTLVGLPLFHLLLKRNATITLCHHYTKDLDSLTKEADIVISAVGKPNLITQLKPDSVAIDIGISRDQKGHLCGDISAQSKEKCSFATPVPGGVGPLTVAMLMENTVKLWRRSMQHSHPHKHQPK